MKFLGFTPIFTLSLQTKSENIQKFFKEVRE